MTHATFFTVLNASLGLILAGIIASWVVLLVCQADEQDNK